LVKIYFQFSEFLIDSFVKTPYNSKKVAGVITMKERSYSELMKSGAMNKQKSGESFVLELYIEMLLSEVLLTSKKEKLLTLIDQAIDDRNQEAFLNLSTQYRELNKQFGT
jgi:uncharacterized protein YpiB (UPF0302 family)